MRPIRPNSKPDHGFTLLELLVVISIIVLLVSILLPSLRQAREHAYRPACASNYHQIGVATMSYTLDHRDMLPWLNSGSYGSLGVAGPGFGSWWSAAQIQSAIDNNDLANFTEEYLGDSWTFDSTNGLMDVPDVLVCPGIDRDTEGPHSHMPGHATGRYKIGQNSRNGSIVGFGSFLGLYHARPDSANGVVANRRTPKG